MNQSFEEQKQYWNRAGPGLVGPLSIKEMKNELRHILPEIRGKILDFGCGIGRFFKILDEPEDYVGIDISKTLLRVLRENNLTSSILINEDCEIPFKNEYFDSIVSYSVLTHLNEDQVEKLIKEFKRVTKKGGVIFFSFFDKLIDPPSSHNWVRYDRNYIKKLIRDMRLVDEIEIRETGENKQIGFLIRK